MKVFTVMLTLSILASSYGYSYVIPASLKHPGICYFNGHVLPQGDNQMPTTCQNMKCNEDGSILVQGCGRLELHKCTLLKPTNLDKPYPDCCEMTYRCTDEDGNMITKQWNQLKQGGSSNSDDVKDQWDQLKKNQPNNENRLDRMGDDGNVVTNEGNSPKSLGSNSDQVKDQLDTLRKLNQIVVENEAISDEQAEEDDENDDEN